MKKPTPIRLEGMEIIISKKNILVQHFDKTRLDYLIYPKSLIRRFAFLGYEKLDVLQFLAKFSSIGIKLDDNMLDSLYYILGKVNLNRFLLFLDEAEISDVEYLLKLNPDELLLLYKETKI